MSSCSLNHLLHPIHVQDTVRSWLREDTPNFDYGGYVVGEKKETAVILCKSSGVLAGVPFVDAIFAELGCDVQWSEREGVMIEDPVRTVATVTGKARHLLLGERIALNCMARASGIATGARRLQALASDAGWHGEVAGTRKTTPGFRLVEKYALKVGGVATHRFDLSGMVMLKDNHIWTAGNITQAVVDARGACGFSTKIEVECRGVEEAWEAAQAGADVVMLDNFEPQALHTAAKQVKDRYPHVLVEASGGVTEDTLTQYLGPHIDVVSLSRTTQGYDMVDFSMKIVKDNKDPSNPLVRTAEENLKF